MPSLGFCQIGSNVEKAGYAVIQVGDLNSKPDSLPYKLFTVEGGLTDSWNVLNKDNVVPNDQIATLSLEDQISLAGVTCNSRLNTWRESRPLWEACRLDYALIDASNITPVSAQVKFVDKLPPSTFLLLLGSFCIQRGFGNSTKEERVGLADEMSNNEEKVSVYREL